MWILESTTQQTENIKELEEKSPEKDKTHRKEANKNPTSSKSNIQQLWYLDSSILPCCTFVGQETPRIGKGYVLDP